MPTTSSPARTRESVCEEIAEQLEPLIQLHAHIREGASPNLDIDMAVERVRAGQPAFDAAAVLGASDMLSHAFTRAVKAFEEAGEVPAAIATALRSRPWNSKSLANSWLAGERSTSDTVRRVAIRAVGLAASAVLSAGARALIAVHPLNDWQRAICPCCGGAPDIVIAAANNRTLLCSRCDTRWSWPASGCPACGGRSAPYIAEVRSPLLGYTLIICNPCGRYIKERTGSAFSHPIVERTLTAELDAAAERRGLRI